MTVSDYRRAAETPDDLLDGADAAMEEAIALASKDELSFVWSIEALRRTLTALFLPIDVPAFDPVEEGWAHVELFGHRQRHGYVRPARIGGRDFIEVRSWSTAQTSDACENCGHRHYTGNPCSALVSRPDQDEQEPCGCLEHRHGPDSLAGGAEPQHVEVYSPAAIFCLTRISEDEARKQAGIPF